jgi:hypothetical protein
MVVSGCIPFGVATCFCSAFTDHYLYLTSRGERYRSHPYVKPVLQGVALAIANLQQQFYGHKCEQKDARQTAGQILKNR